MKQERKEYPRPQFRRERWTQLNGEWEFAYGGEDGKKPKSYGKRIKVPFTYEYAKSGIGESERHEYVWYKRKFKIEKECAGARALLCFNGADWETDVWINGRHALNHTGGFAPFSGDITEYLEDGENEIVVRCYDPSDPTIPRGKQSWTGKPFGCWYIPNTGIWQSVWIEYFGEDMIASWTATPDIDTLSFSGEIETLYAKADEAEIDVYFGGKCIKKQSISLDGKHTRYGVKLMEGDFVDENYYWSPERPNLFEVEVTLKRRGKQEDKVHTRIGMRKISVDGSGNICLNNRKYYQKLILDQGYWEDSGLTPPSAEALKKDIEISKAMGFNGARKHQKFEDPYYYYYADEMGFLVWCEMPSAYNYNAREISLQSKEWQEIIAVARNFASVVCYVPLNESWGVRKIINDESQQNYARALYYLTKSIDGSRLVSTNDGWENIDDTDLISVHDYAYDKRDFRAKYEEGDIDALYPQGRKLMAEGNIYTGLPVLFTEFGGIAMQKNAQGDNWGYNESAKTDEEFYNRLENLMEGVEECSFQGYCYTQLTDVQQEVNGLLTEKHEPKFDISRLNAAFNIKK